MQYKPAVLLVEDEALVVLGVEDALIDAGFEVFSALHGAAAMAEFDSAPDRFACLVTDIRLGGDTDGWAVARHARSKRPDLAVLYMTGHAATQWATEGVAGSVLLKKPFANDELVATVTGLVRQPEPQA